MSHKKSRKINIITDRFEYLVDLLEHKIIKSEHVYVKNIQDIEKPFIKVNENIINVEPSESIFKQQEFLLKILTLDLIIACIILTNFLIIQHIRHKLFFLKLHKEKNKIMNIARSSLKSIPLFLFHLYLYLLSFDMTHPVVNLIQRLCLCIVNDF